MKIKVFIAVFFIIYLKSFSQLLSYKAEDQGYLTQVFETPYGFILTANRHNDVYLYKNGTLIKILSSPGCGRYINLSSNGEQLAFKLILSDGRQQPCIFNLKLMKVIPLHEAVNQCGQPTFDAQGNIYFTIDNELMIYRNEKVIPLCTLPCYVNFIRVSSDGQLITFSIDDQGIALLNLSTLQYDIISSAGAFYPQFSFENRYIAYGSSPNLLYIYDIQKKITYGPIVAAGYKWHPSQNKLLAVVSESNEFNLTKSDVCEITIPDLLIKPITNTNKDFELGCNYNTKGDVLYVKLNKTEIVKKSAKSTKTYKIQTKLEQSCIFPSATNKADVTVPGTVPYVHQVYDTPSWHEGWGSCAPTTAIMAIAYYNKLPKWPVSVNHGQSWDPHVSNYGSYVADRYRFNEWYYQETANAYGTTAYGGYGYMWTGNYSPNSRMKNYIQNHYLTSNQYWTTSCTFNATKTEINNGYVHPICAYLTSSGHLVLAIGYKSNQYTLIFNDPYGNKNTPGYPSYDGAYVYYDWPGYNYGYQNLDANGSYGYIAWTVAARGSQPTYSDTIIDDNHFDHGFFMNNSANGSHMRYFRDFNVGYGGHCWYTLGEASGTDICYCTWTPNITNNGYYTVKAFIPPKGCNTTNAKYKIYHANGVDSVIVNQHMNRNQWVTLGTFYFTTSSQKYVYLGDVTGTTGDSIAFDCVKFSPAQVDNVPPTTAISTPGTWKTQDFQATFTDTDNTGVEKAFYQVLDYDGQYWSANSNRGFFGDNFDTLLPHWNVSTGSWIVQNGELLQNDESLNNTNIYAALNQTLSNRYLYHFKVKLSGSGTTKRFGFHFFCDSASLDNRGNSYFIWFRQATSTLEFYKVVNNSFTTYQHVINNVVTNDNQWYDIIITYDRVSGEIKVWRDNNFLGSWTDPSPHPSTIGKYISFRTGNAKLSVTELKVYRSRYPTVSVTLGNSTKDIRYQNPNPQTYGAKIKSIVVDSYNNLSAIAYHDLNVDWTPPQIVYVYDGNGNDVDTINQPNPLTFEWEANDPNSGIYEYFYALGTSPSDSNIISWTSNGNQKQLVLNNINILPNTIYYLTIRAKNNAGLVTEVSSDGFIYVPTNLPVANFYALDTVLFLPNAYAVFVNTSQNATSYWWDFGDGNTSNAANPYHIYTDTGKYTVTLVAFGNSFTDTLVRQNYIYVKNMLDITNTISDKLEVYPKPCSHILNISWNEACAGSYHFKLINSTGKVVIEGNGDYTKKISLNVSSLSAGIYTLLIPEKKVVEKIVVLR
ncbi:MAG: PKD domain-containing protein [Bacteroidales bacterium]|nr:PKD domain-containing protein [Bacteroidales bacterium]